MATVNTQFIFTVSKIVNIEDSEDAEDKTVDQLTRALTRLGFKVSLEDVGVVDDDDLDDDEEFEDEEDDG